MPVAERMLRPEDRLRQLPDDAGPAQTVERVAALERRDDRAIRKSVRRAVVVGYDDLEPQPLRLLDLRDGGDPAVDGQHEVEAFAREPRERVAVQPVPLLEARRQVPRGVGSELAQEERAEGGGTDSVGVVVAVDADPRTGRDRPDDRGDSLAHVAEREQVVLGQAAVEERARLAGVTEAAPREDGRRHLGDAEGSRKAPHVGVWA